MTPPVLRSPGLRGARALPGPVRLLLASQFAFNVGFYLVVPFLAVHLREDLLLAGWVVGLVLGVRTFSQQGLFFLGGALADRFGVRPVLMVGCLVRIAGFVLLGTAGGFAAVLVGAVLTGFAAALFSPAVEAALAHAGRELEAAGTTTRAELFALDHVVGQVGSLVGPVLGAVLLGVDFTTTCLVAAGLFGVVLAANARWARREHPAGVAPTGVLDGWGAVLRNRRFLLFTALFSTYLLSYNQLYLALPVELRRATGTEDALGALFVVAAVVTVVLQVPLARLARRWGARRAVPAGFAVLAAAFAVVAAATAADVRSVAPAVVFVVVLSLGTALAVPMARDLVPRLAGERHLGAHYGVLASGGGVAVLLGSVGAGGLLVPGESTPWLLLGALPLLSAAGFAVLLRRGERGARDQVDAPTASTDSATSEAVGASTTQGARSA